MWDVTAGQRREAAGGGVITGAGYRPCSWDLRRGLQIHNAHNCTRKKTVSLVKPVYTTNFDTPRGIHLHDLLIWCIMECYDH